VYVAIKAYDACHFGIIVTEIKIQFHSMYYDCVTVGATSCDPNNKLPINLKAESQKYRQLKCWCW